MEELFGQARLWEKKCTVSAVDELETDEVLQDALGPHTSEKFAEAKSQEFSEYLTQVSQWEEDRYLETF